MPCAALCTSSSSEQPTANRQLSGRTRRATLPWHALRNVDEAREIHPRNSHLRRAPERETAGHGIVPMHAYAACLLKRATDVARAPRNPLTHEVWERKTRPSRSRVV